MADWFKINECGNAVLRFMIGDAVWFRLMITVVVTAIKYLRFGIL
jgi:hypothetical protein